MTSISGTSESSAESFELPVCPRERAATSGPGDLVRCAGWALPGALVWTLASLGVGQASSVAAPLGAAAVVGLGASWSSLTLLIGAGVALRSPRAPTWQRLAQRTLLAGSGLTAPLVFGLALTIHRTTHHRPLGAVVLALGGLGLFLASCLVVSRVVLEAHRGSRAYAFVLRLLFGLGGLSGAGLVVLTLAASARAVGLGWVVDTVAGLAAAGLGIGLGARSGQQLVTTLRVLALGGLTAAVACVAWLSADPSLASAMRQAPLLMGLPGLLLR